MKIYMFSGAAPIRSHLIKYLMIMKIIVAILLLAIVQVNAESYAQTITLSGQNVSIENVFKEIKKQTKYRLICNTNIIKGTPNMDLDVKNLSLQEFLDQLAKANDLSYVIENKTIVVKKKPVRNSVLTPPVQQREITGKVTDKQGAPLRGVTVILKHTQVVTTTNDDGQYSISVPQENSILVYSIVGFSPQERAVSSNELINVILEELISDLDEVVVVGYGSEKKVNLSGAISTVNMKSLENRPLTNSSQALYGVKGLYVNQTGSRPGGDEAAIRIRGVGTFNDNNPLVLVDGIEYSLRDIDPSDIESISVLKDASSAAIYGNKAANGVILITTKGGKAGKLQVEFENYYGLQKNTRIPELVTNSYDFLSSLNEAVVNDGQPPLYSDELLEEWRTGNNPDKYPNTDWMSIIFRTASIHEHKLRLTGGSDNVTYSTSLGFMDQEGILIGTEGRKYSLNNNVNYKYSDKLSFGLILRGSFWDDRQPQQGIETFTANSYTRLIPIIPNILSNGNYGDKWVPVPGFNVLTHPVATANETYLKTKTQRALVQLTAEYKLPFNIVYNVDYAINKYNINASRWQPDIRLYRGDAIDVSGNLNGGGNRIAYRSNNDNLSTTFFNTFTWKDQLFNENHNFSTIVGFSKQKDELANFNAKIEGFLGNELQELAAGTTSQVVGGTSSKSTLMSYFGRVNYNYSEKYLFEFNFRYDGSSRFAKKRLWGFFPSFSAGWRIGEENFLKESNVFNDLKVRFSYGELGNQNIPLYSYLNNINTNQNVIFGNQINAGAAVTGLSDPDITWEKTTIADLGLDVLLLQNRLEFNFDIFNKITSDILTRINIPAQIGDLSGPLTNFYKMSNKGLELSIGYRNRLPNFGYHFSGQVSLVRNKVLFVDGAELVTTNRYGPISIIKEGYPINSWYGYQADGLFQTEDEVSHHAQQHPNTSPGDIIYRDANEDGVINEDDMGVMGRSTPKFTYGFNLGFNYKKLELSAVFQGVDGIDMYPWGNIIFGHSNGGPITKDMFENSWTPDNPNAKYPRLFEPIRGTQINSQNSTFWLSDASYLRLKNIQISYLFDLHHSLGLNSILAYINGQNILTFSKYKITDPERNISQQTLNEYPMAKIYSIGCIIKF